MKKIINTDKAPGAIGPYSQANMANGILYISGQIPVDPQTGKLAEGIEKSTHQVMKNLEAILTEAGLTFSHVVKATIFLKSMDDFAVMNDIWGQRNWTKLTPQSKIVILTTLVLLVFGTLILFLLEKDNTGTIGGLGVGGKLLASWFESVTARTAGFAMFDNGLLTESSLLMLILLMFIGASPASTGGGIKTSTFAIIVASIWSLIRGREDVVLFSRTVSVDVILRALAIFFLAASVTFFAAAYLCLTEGIPVIKAGFEVVSAFATVGLSTGITAELSSDGKFLLIVMMLMGRVGIITFAMAFARKRNNRRLCRHPEGKFVIG